MTEFRMPSLGADMEEGTLLEWLVASGDHVHKGDIVAVVDTDKSAVDIECFADGTIEEILVPAGTRVPVGTPLARIGDGTTAEPAPPRAEAQPKTAQPKAFPPVRKLAHQAGVDLAGVHGTGHDGTITRTDVERAATRPPDVIDVRAEAGDRTPVSPYARRLARERGVDLTTLQGPEIHGVDVLAAADAGPRPDTDTDTMRSAIARLMSRSKREIPHYYLSSSIDLHTTVEWLRKRNRAASVAERIVPAALLIKATALAAAEVSAVNGHWVQDSFRPGAGVHVGLVVSLRGGGIMVPTVEEPGTCPLDDLMGRLTDVVRRARSGRLRSSELSPATITVTDLGDLGVDSVHGVIYPPQVALVGFGAIAERPWVVDGLLGARPLVTATLAGDHRATDGATGARFLHAIDHLLQRPEELE